MTKNYELKHLKERVTYLNNEVKKIRSNTKDALTSLALSSEFQIVEAKIEELKAAASRLTMESAIYDFLKISALMKEVEDMIFNLDYVIPTPDYIVPVIGDLLTKLGDDKKVSVQSTQISDPELRLRSVEYTLFSGSGEEIDTIKETNVYAEVHFNRTLRSDNYYISGKFFYQGSDNLEILEKISSIFTVSEEAAKVATVKLDAPGKWGNSFAATLEVISHTDENYGGDWELTFDTKLTSFQHWQLEDERTTQGLKLTSAKDWSGRPHISLPPNGKFIYHGISAGGAPFSKDVISNCLLNGRPVHLYLDGEKIDEEEIILPNIGELKISLREDNRASVQAMEVVDPQLRLKKTIYQLLNESGELLETRETANVSSEVVFNTVLKPGSYYFSGEFHYQGESQVGSIMKTSQTLTVDTLPTEGTEGFKIVGYYPYWKDGDLSKEIQWDKITHLIYAFALPDTDKKDGSLMPLPDPDRLKEIVDKARKSDVKVLISLGGWSSGEELLGPVFSEICSTKAGRETLVNEVFNLVNHYQLDGVDVDWEHPQRGSDDDNFTQLILEFNKKLKPQGHLLTLAVQAGVISSGTSWQENWHSMAITDEAIRHVDWLNIMAYAGGDGELHSPISQSLAAMDYWKNTRNIDKLKLVLGVPFYSRPAFKAYRELVELDPSAPEKDVVEGMYYNGIPTIKEKTRLAKEKGNGIMAWELSHDTQDKNSLLKAIYDVVNPGEQIEVDFPDNLPISGAVTVGTLRIGEDSSSVHGKFYLPSDEIYDEYAVYVNNSIALRRKLPSELYNTTVDIFIDVADLPLIAGNNQVSVVFASTENNTVTFYESNSVSIIHTQNPTIKKGLVGYWSSWGGNGPTSYIDLEDVPSEYGTIVAAFILNEADRCTPKFDPSASGRVTKEEFKEKVKRMKQKGHDVIISLGGDAAVFKLSDQAQKETFKRGVISIIEEYGFNGVDIDLEGGAIGGSGNYDLIVEAIQEIVEHFRLADPEFVYSLAPEVAYLIHRGFGDFYIKLIQKTMDLITTIHPQYYNAPGTGVYDFDGIYVDCRDQKKFIPAFTQALILGHDGPGWGQSVAQTFHVGPLPAEKLMIGLPAGRGAAGTGVPSMEDIKIAWNELLSRNIDNIKGFMTWSIDWDAYHNWQFKDTVKELLKI
ncbi:hypothetical protein PM10SUCC1_29110 [Propionigenium maris DSM 9537]|uniref:chitinase n=1 Tax=Propionigenium maris DSM 9537 TaxID=1123000 RepID=A0A9W6GN45_9FUSO|nr:glycosyl hydrolase family 18 protein [Propionigenium maris]GLI57397.1 hypothetical protein PM10SUCC1_29110 [Propionigenium maris DSM 9537]